MRKIWIIIGVSCLVAGLAIFGAAFAAAGFDWSKLSTASYQTNTYEPQGSFHNICVDVITDDITFALAEDGKCKVVCKEREKVKHSVTVKDDKLVISVDDQRKWYDHIDIFELGGPALTVYLPEKQYKELKVSLTTGDVEIPRDFAFENVQLESTTGSLRSDAQITGSLGAKTTTGSVTVGQCTPASMHLSATTGQIDVGTVTCSGAATVSIGTGDVFLADLTCESLTVKGSTSDITMLNTQVQGKMSVNVTTGDVTFEYCDAGELEVEATTGDVEGSLCSPKIFIARTSTGDVDVPETSTGGKCKITTSTGDIEITVENKE